MGVGADDAVAGGHNALLGQQGMLDAHLAHIVEVADAVSAGKLPALLALLGGLDVLIGDKMVQHDGDLILIENALKAGLLELVDRHGSGDVVAQDDIQLCLDQLAGGHSLQPRMGGKYFLSHGHSHGNFLLIRGSYCCMR